MIGRKVPAVTFKTRVRDESIGGDNPFRWQDMTTDDYFKGKKVVLFSLPGAFTPTCSTFQLPDFEKLFGEFKAKGVEAIYCMSVNDSFVMNAWKKSQNLENVDVIQGPVEAVLPDLVAEEPLGGVVLDPPRQWLDVAVVDALVESGPPRVVYVSCDPATLARDIKRLARGGYTLTDVQPVDMFPQTFHVETVALLIR